MGFDVYGDLYNHLMNFTSEEPYNWTIFYRIFIFQISTKSVLMKVIFSLMEYKVTTYSSFIKIWH